MDIGILGGTFNPIHNGHLIVAEQIREWFSLARIYFVPSAIPPHKEGPVPEGDHRLRMIELATDSNPYFIPSAIELERGGRSYTIDTVHQMAETLGEGHIFYFILGTDAFQDIQTWKDYRQLLQMCKFIVISRPGARIDQVFDALEPLLTHPGLHLVLRRIGEEEGSGCIDAHSADIFFVPIPEIDISSSGIREKVRQGKSIRYQVPVEIKEYIERHGLYLS